MLRASCFRVLGGLFQDIFILGDRFWGRMFTNALILVWWGRLGIHWLGKDVIRRILHDVKAYDKYYRQDDDRTKCSNWVYFSAVQHIYYW